MKSIESVADMRRNATVAMRNQDLAELYNYLLLFTKTYSDREDEVRSLVMTIHDIFLEQSEHECRNDAGYVLSTLRNPRGAGRKSGITQEQSHSITELHKAGLSIRDISRKLTISKSTIQRVIAKQNPEVSHI